jgi:CRP-like cAMP-binding protein
MSLDAVVAPLMRVRLFQSLSDAQLLAIAKRTERAMFRTGSRIAEAGQEADAAILIVDGPCARIDAGANAAGGTWIEPGSVIGEMAMLVEHEFGATVVAEGTVKALRLPRAAMLELMQADPDLAERLISVLADRLHAVAEQMRAVDRDLQYTVGEVADGLDLGSSEPAGSSGHPALVH